MSSSWPEVLRNSIPAFLVPHLLLYAKTGDVVLKRGIGETVFHDRHLTELLSKFPREFAPNPFFSLSTCAAGLNGLRGNEGYFSNLACSHSEALGKRFAERIWASEHLDNEKKGVMCNNANAILFLVMNSLAAPDQRTQRQHDMLDLRIHETPAFRNTPAYVVVAQLTAMVAAFVKSMHESYATQPEDAIRKMCSYCLFMLDQYTNTMGLYAQALTLQVCPPTYMNMRDRARLAILMLHPAQRQLIKLFPARICPFRGARAVQGRLDRAKPLVVPYEHWRELCRFIPTVSSVRADFPKKKLLSDFVQLVWTPDLKAKTDVKFKSAKEKEEYYRPTVYTVKTDTDLLMQICTLFLSNWNEIWTRMGWPRSRTVQLRLHKLKRELDWQPDVRDLVEVFLKWKPVD